VLDSNYVEELLERLKEAGSMGLDLSPGDPLCMETYHFIRALQEKVNRSLKESL
jgi:hypothetical protein